MPNEITSQAELPITPAAEPTPAAAAPAEPVGGDAKPSEPVSRRDAIAKAMDTPRADGRDEKGKFVAKPAEPAAVVVAKKERKYPSSFKPDYKTQFDELSANEKYHGILDEIERREGEYHKGIEPYKESATFAQSIRKAIQPYEQTLKGLNMAPEAAINALLNADHQLRTLPPAQKQAYLAQLAQQYGIQLGGEPQEPPAVDPYVQALWQQQQQTNQVLQQFMTDRQRQEHESATSSIEAFRKDHEFLDEVRNKMADLIDKGFAKGLDDAYAQAIRLDDAIHQKVWAKQQAQAESKRREESQQTVQRAQAAAVQIKGAPSTGTSATRQPSGRNRRETIAKLLDGSV